MWNTMQTQNWRSTGNSTVWQMSGSGSIASSARLHVIKSVTEGTMIFVPAFCDCNTVEYPESSKWGQNIADSNYIKAFFLPVLAESVSKNYHYQQWLCDFTANSIWKNYDNSVSFVIAAILVRAITTRMKFVDEGKLDYLRKRRQWIM